MADMRLVVVGAAGRMGRTIIRLVAETDGLVLSGALEHAGSPALGEDAGLLAGCAHRGVTIGDDALPLVVEADGIIDFSTPATSVALAALALPVCVNVSHDGIAPEPPGSAPLSVIST